MVIPFYSGGQIAFHLELIKTKDIYGYKEFELLSNLPEEVLHDTPHNYYKWILSNNDFLQRHNEKLAIALGRELLHNPKSKEFYYPKWLVPNNKVTGQWWHQFQAWKDGFIMEPQQFFSKENNPTKFYILCSRFIMYRLYQWEEFQEINKRIAKADFERVLKTEQLKMTYLQYYNTNHIRFYTCANEYLRFYLLCQEYRPKLIVTTKLTV